VRSTGKSKFNHKTKSPQTETMLRVMHVLNEFDRIGLAMLAGVPFGSAARAISELANSGYIQPLEDMDLLTLANLVENLRNYE